MSYKFKKIGALLMALFNILFGSYIIMQLLSLVSTVFLRAGYLEGSGAFEFVRVVLGIIFLFVLAAVWISLIVYCINQYLKRADSDQSLFQSFSLVTSIEFFLLALMIILYQITFPFQMFTLDWILLLTGIIMGTIFIFLYIRKTRKSV